MSQSNDIQGSYAFKSIAGDMLILLCGNVS
jgi:hypothetical protein